MPASDIDKLTVHVSSPTGGKGAGGLFPAIINHAPGRQAGEQNFPQSPLEKGLEYSISKYVTQAPM